ncbi:MFS transporter [Pseudonocardia oroxyli]|uniref:Drug resistance transporter, EmrB/QacA subfamily n=1 Tax=Pseudonocardia oroxyli TaxID=366584 RepID=A0A1G7TY42_PSEOR|nr:MFS transporter [Pseudonocardia oroxyli]SDG39991.1 drug resistance transporter, EmrB/QacA subfamily [Pseudonocardia oroxyli]
MSELASEPWARNDPTGRRGWTVLVVTTFGSLLVFLNSTATNVALPAISADLSIAAATADWILLSFMLTLSMSVLVVSRISDMVGRRRIYLAGLGILVVSSVGAAFATGPAVLATLRGVQGVAAAIIITGATAVISDVFPAHRLAGALSINIMTASAAGMLGPLVGALLLESLGWRSLFLVNVPFGLVALALAAKVLPRDRRARRAGESLDVPGAVLSAVGLACLLLAVNRSSAWGVTDPRVLGLGVAAVAILGAFVVVERRAARPLVDLGLVADRNRALAYATAFLMALPQAAALVLVVLYQQTVLGSSSVEAGIAATVTAAALVVTSPVAGVLARFLTPRAVSSAGCALTAVGYLLLGLSMTGAGTGGAFWVGLVLVGAGNGIFMAPNTASIVRGLPVDRRGIANGIRSLMFNSAQTLGAALALLLAAAGLAGAGIGGYDGVIGRGADPAAQVSAALWGFHLAAALLVAFAVAATVTSLRRSGGWLVDQTPESAAAAVPSPASRGEDR